MIRPLRRLHRFAFTLLAAVLPVLFVAGLLARKLPEPMERLPEALLPAVPAAATVTVESADLWKGARLVTRLGPPSSDRDGSGWILELEPLEPLGRPDVLVYWAAVQPARGGAPPEDAWLLGTLRGGGPDRFRLPRGGESGGYLALYSLPHNETFATAELPAAAAGE